MALQRGEEGARIWGTGTPGRTVTVVLQGRSKETEVRSTGNWQIIFPELRAQSTGTLSVSDGTSRQLFQNVAIGDVWVASGQSNMEWPLWNTDNGEDNVRAAWHADLRLFQVARKADVDHEGDVQGTWQVCTPESVRSFSAVAYYFGRSIKQTEGVTIGLIDTTWGGTRVEAWTPWSTLAANPATRQGLIDFEMDLKQRSRMPAAERELAQLRQPNGVVRFFPSRQPGWLAAALDDSGWGQMTLPGQFPQGFDGALWLRKTVQIAQPGAGRLSIEAIDDHDEIWVNGTKIGETRSANSWQQKRSYPIPAGVLKQGKNVIAIRAFDINGVGSVSGPITLNAGGRNMNLAGPWKMKVEVNVPAATAVLPRTNPNAPSALWAGMVKPIVPFHARGFLWYQGESNAGDPKSYESSFPAMIQAWRDQWGQGDLPFLFVQLAAFRAGQQAPVETGWGELRYAQEKALALPTTGMAITTDIGAANDIHPRNKRDVGERLALAARAIVPEYGGPEALAPRVDTSSQKRIGSRLIFEVEHGRGLQIVGGGWAVKGEDGTWHWGNARMEGRRLVVWSNDVTQPIAAAYNWADNPLGRTRTAQGLPLAPFRSDFPFIPDQR